MNENFKVKPFPDSALPVQDQSAPTLSGCSIRLAGFALVCYALSLIFPASVFSQWLYLGWGFALGFLYVASLIVKNYIFSGRFKRLLSSNMALFFLFSLLRVVFFGYAFFLVFLTGGRDSQRLLLVFSGFLGYSSWIFLEYLVNAFRLNRNKY